jgi:ATP-dependent RNA helicase DDX49/DBP8
MKNLMKAPTKKGKKRRRVVTEGSSSATSATSAAAATGAAPALTLADKKDTPTDYSWVRSFKDLGLSEDISKMLGRMGIAKPTPVQSACIPQILDGKNTIGLAQTGSGKTAAFALPILHRLSKDPYGVFAVVITPTRELAYQISEQFHIFGNSMGLVECCVVGGMDMLTQSLALQKRPHVVVATPGRLADHLRSAAPPVLRKAKFLVLDEADRLLNSQFVPDLKEIMDALAPPHKRQTLLFSATDTDNMRALESMADDDYFRFESYKEGNATTVDTLQQYYVLVPKQIKQCYLVHLVRKIGPQPKGDDEYDDDCTPKEFSTVVRGTAPKSMIIFVATCKMCQLLVQMMLELGISCAALHSMMGQKRRIAALSKFKSSLVPILICTDVASRGLDIPTVDLVLNFDIPRDPSDYIHRVGRTARAGHYGSAVSLVAPSDVELIKSIETEIGKEMAAVPDEDVREDQVLRQINEVRDLPSALFFQHGPMPTYEVLCFPYHSCVRNSHPSFSGVVGNSGCENAPV